ncbi:11706_t:CDS:1, partial [Paraglomus brasilianum]
YAYTVSYHAADHSPTIGDVADVAQRCLQTSHPSCHSRMDTRPAYRHLILIAK